VLISFFNKAILFLFCVVCTPSEAVSGNSFFKNLFKYVDKKSGENHKGRYEKALSNIYQTGGESSNTYTDKFFDALNVGLEKRKEMSECISSCVGAIKDSEKKEGCEKMIALLFSINFEICGGKKRQINFHQDD
jgi:hypothetical protein